MTDKRIVLSTAGSREEAEHIARALVERRLAACVNVVGGVTSTFWWKEKIENSTEVLLMVKTTQALFDQVRDTIRELHSYELPECIAVAIETGSAEYLEWLAESVEEE